MMRALAAIVCLFASGCAFRPQIERVAVDHNELAANTANELLLVNILRARERQPLHFTSIATLFGDAQVNGTVGANTAVRGGTPTSTTNAAGDLVQIATLAGDTFVRTSFGGRPHYVPGSPDGRLDDVGGRSKQVFTLVQQLLNLQKTAKERPTTQAVRVVR